MNQRELARALGIDPAAVSRLKAKGMPVESIDAAQAWRRRHVAPYAKSQAPSSPAPARPGNAVQLAQHQRAQQPPHAAEPAAAIEAMVREVVFLPRELLPLAISAVDVLIQHRLAAREAAADVRPLLCELLRQQPAEERRISVAAWGVATGQVPSEGPR